MPVWKYQRAHHFALALLLCLLLSCSRREIEVYSVAKGAAAESPAPTAPAVMLPGPPDPSWLPADPAGGPRVASFVIASPAGSGDPADMGVTVFPGTAGGLLANVNRWRGEMAQPPVTESGLDEVFSSINVGTHTVHLMDAASAERRTLGAILPLAAETWFFKLTGPTATVATQQAAFMGYVEAIQITADPAEAPAPTEVEPQRPTITYQTPPSWIEGEAAGMRAASFTVTGEGGHEADISVIPLGGSGGAQLAVVNQWRATLRLDAATEAQLPGMIQPLEAGGRSFDLVDIESADAMLDGDRKARILVAFATVGEHTWFFKIAGESSLVTAQKPVLIEFLNSVQFPAP